VGLLSWFAGRYYIRSARRAAEDVRSLPSDTRKAAVMHLAQQMRRTTEAEPQGASAVAVTVQQVFQQATHERQMAVAQGASSRTDPAWCTATLVETWAGARHGAIWGRISKSNYDKVDAIMYDLIMETLAPDELASLIG
jgi:hypothetical protein